MKVGVAVFKFGVWGLWFVVCGLGFVVWGLGIFGVWSLEFRIEGCVLTESRSGLETRW